MNIIEAINLTKEFKGVQNREPLVAVDDVSLGVEKGEIVGLLGINGAGKTTLLKMICGLLLPTRGEVLVNGLSLRQHRSEVLGMIGAVLEGSRNALWSLTVKQNLTYFGHLKNTHGKALKDRGDELLRFFQLEKKKDELVKNLSKGMKQKLAIILAFINDPELILLDEPTLGLDIHTSALVKQRIVDLARDRHKTIFLTTHQLEIVEEICDRVAIIHQGRLLAFERTETLLGNMGREHYVITFDSQPDISILQKLSMVRDVQLLPRQTENPAFAFRLVLDREHIFYEVLNALPSTRARVLSIEKSDPKLEDVYVRMIGQG